jgi:hypothetical protein
VAELNSGSADIQPNVRRDGREIVFASIRGRPTPFGGQRIWRATRKDLNRPWSASANLGSANTGAMETRPRCPGTGRRSTSGAPPVGPVTTDIFFATRSPLD